jgi:hypothetical protein
MKTSLSLFLILLTTLFYAQSEQEAQQKAQKFRYFGEVGNGYLAGNYEARPLFNVKNGLFIGNHWGVSFNTGIESFQQIWYLPLGLDGKFVLRDKKTSPFVSFSANYLQAITRPYYYHWANEAKNYGFNIGARIGIQHFFTPGVALISGLGYRYAQSHAVNQGEINPWQPQEIQTNMHRFELSIGLLIR